MKYIYLSLIFLLFSTPALAQESQNAVPLPRSADDFAELLDNGYHQFTVPYDSGVYDLVFDEQQSFHLPSGLQINFTEAPPNSSPTELSRVVIDNIKITGDNQYDIQFIINHPVQFELRNSTIKQSGFMNFRIGYEDNLFPGSLESEILVQGNYIENVNYSADYAFAALNFQRHTGSNAEPPRPVSIKNITLKDNHIVVKRDAESSDWSEEDFYLKWAYTYALNFYRLNNHDYIRDITIEENFFDLNNEPGIDTPVFGIQVYNRAGQDFEYRNYLLEELYAYNKNLKINNNTFITQSRIHTTAAYLAGPFDGVEFNGNHIEGFGRYQIHNCPHQDEDLCEDFDWGYEPRPVVVFYGARNTKNVNNFRNLIAENNYISTATSGFRINGMLNGIFRNNVVNMEEAIEVPPFYNNRSYRLFSDRSGLKISSGHAWEAQYKSRNITLESNTVYGNDYDFVTGIRIFHASDVKVIGNKIYEFTSNGIHHESSVTWADDQSVGNMEIRDNYITTSRYFEDLDSNRRLFFGFLDTYEHLDTGYFLPQSMINFSRHVVEDKIGQIQNETIKIENNTLKKRDVDTLPVVFVNAVIKNNGEHNSFSEYDPLLSSRNSYQISGNLQNEFKKTEPWITDDLFKGWYFADLNGNGLSDIFSPVSDDSGIDLWFAGKNNFEHYFGGRIDDIEHFGQIYTGRFTQQNRDEILTWEERQGSGIVRIYSPEYREEAKQWRFKLSVKTSLPGTVYGDWVIGDFNGNGYDDLARALTSTGGAEVFLNNEQGSFSEPEIWLDESVKHYGKWKSGDFNGDGRSDLLGNMNVNGGAVAYYSEWPERSFADGRVMSNAGTSNEWIVGDFSGDGYDDIMIQTSGSGGMIRIWYGYNIDHPINDRGFHNGSYWGREIKYDRFVAGNFLPNGKKDLAGINNQTGQVFILENKLGLIDQQFYADHYPPEGLWDREITELPGGFTLEQNYPNPFNSGTVIRYKLQDDSQVLLEVYDITGRRVATLVDGSRIRGTHVVNFDAGRLASGVYFYRLALKNSGAFKTRKMMIIK